MEVPEDLLYTREHSWVRQEGDGQIVVGVTEFQMEVIGSLESLRGVTEIYSPASGKVTEVNELLLDDPTIINDDPYGNGWIAVLELEDPEELKRLMDAIDYQALIERDLKDLPSDDEE